ncbi:MAG: hypothetical protein ACRDJ4_03760 [Actinomycetota bacterium]
MTTSALVNHFYLYAVDDDFGPFFFKFGTYFPYPAKVCLNGHHFAQRQAAKAGIGFETLDNGFVSADDPPALGRMCRSLTHARIASLVQVATDPAPSLHRRGPGGGLPLRHLHPAGPSFR